MANVNKKNDALTKRSFTVRIGQEVTNENSYNTLFNLLEISSEKHLTSNKKKLPDFYEDRIELDSDTIEKGIKEASGKKYLLPININKNLEEIIHDESFNINIVYKREKKLISASEVFITSISIIDNDNNLHNALRLHAYIIPNREYDLKNWEKRKNTGVQNTKPFIPDKREFILARTVLDSINAIKTAKKKPNEQLAGIPASVFGEYIQKLLDLSIDFTESKEFKYLGQSFEKRNFQITSAYGNIIDSSKMTLEEVKKVAQHFGISNEEFIIISNTENALYSRKPGNQPGRIKPAEVTKPSGKHSIA